MNSLISGPRIERDRLILRVPEVRPRAGGRRCLLHDCLPVCLQLPFVEPLWQEEEEAEAAEEEDGAGQDA